MDANFVRFRSIYHAYCLNKITKHTKLVNKLSFLISLLVGAPRAQPFLPAQQNIEEIGAVYKCQFVSENCSQFVLDKTGNILEEPSKRHENYKTQVKDRQWLGGTMDGFGANTDTFVVCAYKFKAVSKTVFTPYYLHGICYVTQSTNGSQPSKVTMLNPYSLRGDEQLIIFLQSKILTLYSCSLERRQ
jgi:hypothetical protein